jgi:hypothetical protein
MINNNFVTYSFTFYIVIEYFKMYKNKELYNWGSPDSGDIQHRPILKGAITEPMNSYSSFIYLIFAFKYKDNIFNFLQKLTVINLSFGSFFYHGSVTDYGLYLDYNAINFYLINLFLKDYYIMRYITNDEIISKNIPYLFLYMRLIFSPIIKKTKPYYSNIYRFQSCLFDLLFSAKVINEIVKLNNNDKLKSSPYFILWFIAFLYKSNKEKKSIVLKKKQLTKKWKNKNIKSLKRQIADIALYLRGTDNNILIYSKYIFQIVYFYRIVITSKSKQPIDTKNLGVSVPIAMSSLLFYGDYTNCCRGKSKSQLPIPFHSIWHILSGIAFYYYDCKYLKSNVENV